MNRKREGNHLLVDAAGPLIQTGLWREGRWLAWQSSREEAGRSIFQGVADIFRRQQISLTDLSGFFFCEGPGSMLGVRMAAMAIQGWQSLLDSPLPIFIYNSHELLARALLARATPPPFHVISDARRNRWNVTSVRPGGIVGPLQRIAAEQMNALDGPVYRMEEIIRNVPGISGVELLPYDLEQEAELFLDPDLLRQASAPEVWMPEAPEYQKWSADRHR